MSPHDTDAPPPLSHVTDVTGTIESKSKDSFLSETLPESSVTSVTCDKLGERRRKKALAAEILSLRATQQQALLYPPPLSTQPQRPDPPAASGWLDHVHFWRRGHDLVVWDDPYLPSNTLDTEWILRREGWRIRHLPTSQSLWIAGKCQPRLLAPPGSKADLEQMAELLRIAEFRGCFALTEKFYEGDDPNACAVRRRLASEGIICQ